MSRKKVDEPKTTRTSLCFKESELQAWKQYQQNNGFKSFSEFVRVCITNYIEGEQICQENIKMETK